MLHDLLAAMKGHGGSIFVWNGSKFKVINDLELLHPCEVAIAEEMLEVATDFKKITAFCDTNDGGNGDPGCHQQGGIYLSSLSAALRTTTTATLHHTVLGLEQRLLADPELPLTAALVALRPLAPTLASLAALVSQIEEKHFHGCQVLETVHKFITHSVGQVKLVLSRIEQEVHAVLYHQLTLWLLHGHLLDPHQEFFISTTTSSSSATTTTSTSTSSISQQIDTLSLEEGGDEMVSAPECHLRLEMLPAHIPLSVAEKILFIGEFILVFERGAVRENGESEPSLASSRSGQVLKKREGEFRGLLADLAAEQTFSVEKFSHAIEAIRNCVSEELWKLVMEAGLLGELSDLKAVFLLGRGELFQTLVPIITPFLQTCTDFCATDFTGLFRSAGRQVLMEDTVLEKFSLSLKMPPTTTTTTTTTQTSEERWRALRLTYSARWPLRKLLTPTAQEKYNAIFSFLLDVRRAQHRLQQLWLIQRRAARWDKRSCLRWTLRHHMSLLIDNIQYYLQADVLESQHWQLVRAVSETRDYQQLVSAHHTFLASVAAQCFLHSPVVASTLHCLLGLVHQFCAHLESSLGHEETEEEEVVEHLHEEFERAAAQLFFVLSNLRLHRGEQHQHTSQLIMRIDYNWYYSRHSGSLHRLTVVHGAEGTLSRTQ